FLSGNVADWVSYIVVKPYGSGHYLNGVTVTGNVFRTINGTIDRVDRVDTTFAELDFSKTKNVTFLGNTYHSVTAQVMNPLRVRHNQSTFASTWTVDPAGELPFGAQARGVDGIVALDHIRATGGVEVFEMPYALVQQGSGQDKVKLLWSQEMRGEVAVSIRIDT
ncbi:MAG: right-handed parallel beta-helix repeat-containing protein, partial [Pseudodonghicola sp.]